MRRTMGIKSRNNFKMGATFCKECRTLIKENILCNKCYIELLEQIKIYNEETPTYKIMKFVTKKQFEHATKLISLYEKQN